MERQPHAGLSFRSSLVWGVIGSVAFGLSQWLLIVILARTGTATLVGQFSLALAVVAPVQMIANMQLSNVLATDAGSRFSFGTYLGARWISLAGMSVIVSLLCLVQRSFQLKHP